MNRFINKVFNGDALDLLRAIPTASIDDVIADAMYGTAKNCRYDWGIDPARGDSVTHWQNHRPIYEECRRVLKPGGILAWGQGIKFAGHFPTWFGPHGLWPLARRGRRSRNWISCHLWIVQTKEQQPIPLPSHYKLIEFDILPPLTVHPCPKPVEEMAFLIEALTKPGQIVLPQDYERLVTEDVRRLFASWLGYDYKPLSKKQDLQFKPGHTTEASEE